MNAHPSPQIRLELAAKALLHLLVGFSIMMGMLFLPAGTCAFWDAWIYLLLIVFCAIGIGIYLLIDNPDLLNRRLSMKERERSQQWIMGIGTACYAAIFIIAGFDHRYGWSHVTQTVVATADFLVLATYVAFLLVMRQNRYASRIIEVVEDQQLIADGFYAIVRHPMYLAALTMIFATPVALGSWWSLLPALPMVPILMARILAEESFLREKLPGYAAYMMKTRYRLIPGIW